MTNPKESIRLAQSGVHDNPDFVLKYLEEIELLAENVIAERREIIELNKRRDKLREASRYVLFTSFINLLFLSFSVLYINNHRISRRIGCV
jgi:hypothetical protein